MIDGILTLVPDYCVSLIFGVVLAACLAVPVPASMAVLTAGGFVAAGDLMFWHVFAVALLAYILGDQLAYGLAAKVGARILPFLEASERTAPIIAKSKALLDAKGTSAVFLSHTILSPTCPYVSYLCGAGGMSWRNFTLAAVPGAVIWTGAYVGLGFVFASQLEQLAQILGNFFGVILAGCAALGAFVLINRRWDAQKKLLATQQA